MRRGREREVVGGGRSRGDGGSRGRRRRGVSQIHRACTKPLFFSGTIISPRTGETLHTLSRFSCSFILDIR